MSVAFGMVLLAEAMCYAWRTVGKERGTRMSSESREVVRVVISLLCSVGLRGRKCDLASCFVKKNKSYLSSCQKCCIRMEYTTVCPPQLMDWSILVVSTHDLRTRK